MLTEDMTRLSKEIDGLRQKRAGLIRQLADGGQQRQKSVSEFRSNANWSFKSVANALREKRVNGLDHLRREVSGVRQEVSNDLKGVRRAWTVRA